MTFNSTDAPVANTHTWLTPKYIIDALGTFDLDPCAAPDPRPFPTAIQHFTEIEGDGLLRDWCGRIWLNPPYGDMAQKWVEKLLDHGSGVALVFGRTDTKWFQKILGRSGIFFMSGRIRFLTPDGTPAQNSAGAPSVLIPASPRDLAFILASGIDGIWKQ